MKIGNKELNNNVFLAPMAGVTDLAYRALCKEMGCGLVYTEMISAKALYHNNQRTLELMEISEKEKPVAIQIFGNEPEIMAEAVRLNFNGREDITLIDINMGCPMNKVTKSGEGSALLKNPGLASKIVESIKKVSDKPVTAKIRIGWDENSINAVEMAKALEAGGADAVTIHGRTRNQLYEGKANWDVIGEVKNSVNIPVIGNGDIFTPEDALSIRKKTNCDGIMIARGSMGNPWIFKQIELALKGENPLEITNSERIDMCMKHYDLSVNFNGSVKAIREMRKHIGWYIKSLPSSNEFKNQINKANSQEEVFKLLEEYKIYLNNL